jgi:hypothetical membrane protein
MTILTYLIIPIIFFLISIVLVIVGISNKKRHIWTMGATGILICIVSVIFFIIALSKFDG